MRRAQRAALVGLGAVAAFISGLLAMPPVHADIAAQSQTIVISLGEYTFTPTELSAASGFVALRIVNDGIRRHNLVLQIDGIERASPPVRPGEAVDWEIELARPGRYLFWCGEYRHLEKGMAGTLIVEGR